MTPLRFILTYIVLPIAGLGLGLGIGYTVQHPDIFLTHHLRAEDALDWALLDEGYKAMLKPNDFLSKDGLAKIHALNGKRVAVLGYMFPQDTGNTHTRFLISSKTHSCPFCMPNNAGNLVDVTTDKGVEYQSEPILVEGIFHIHDAKEDGLVYAVEGASVISQ